MPLRAPRRGWDFANWNAQSDLIQSDFLFVCLSTIFNLWHYQRGVISFEFEGDPQLLEVHLFRSDDFKGTIKESEVVIALDFFFYLIPKTWHGIS